MWIVNGGLLGTVLFLLGSVIYLITKVYASGAGAKGTTAIQAWAIQNPLYWLAFGVALAVGCLIMRKRAIKANSTGERTE